MYIQTSTGLKQHWWLVNWAMNPPVARIPIRSYTTMSSFASIDIFSIVPIPTNYMELQNVMPTEFTDLSRNERFDGK